MGRSEQPVVWPLKYWLSGEDSLVNGKWVDRINSNVQWTVGASVTYDSTNGRYLFMGRTSGRWPQDWIAELPTNLINLYNLGYHWKMIVKGTFLNAPASISGSHYFIDFGSVTQAQFNIGWGVENKKFYTNFKTSGNISTYSCTATNALVDATSSPFDFEVEFGCEAVTETTSRLYTLYDNTYYYGTAFSNMLFTNWNSRAFYIGQGFAGTNYGCDFYLSDWKIYVEDYE